MCVKDVETLLQKNYASRHQIVICGIEAHVCVLQTCLDLLDKNYEVHLAADGISSSRMYERSVGLERMKQCGAFVSSAESIIFQWTKDAKRERFKEISALNKKKRQQP